MNTELSKSRLSSEVIEKLALSGDVSGLTREEKVQYYRSLCDRVGLDSATQPFKLLKLSGKEVFYCDRSGAQQLSRLHGVSHEVRAREIVNDCYVVTVRASSNGRSTESIGAVPIAKLQGEALCNAYMKAETKGKRRATLDLLGLGMLDESEIGSIPGAQTEAVETPVARITNGAPVQTPAAPKATVATPKPNGGASSKLREATDETKHWMFDQFEKTGFTHALLEDYAKKNSILLPTENLSDWPLTKVPTTKEELETMKRSIDLFSSGGESPKENEAFKEFIVPYGRFAGKKLGDLDTKTIYGFWAGHTVETEYNGKPKRPETIAKDQAFRDALDAAGRKYEFTKKD